MDCQTLQDAWRRHAADGVTATEACPAVTMAEAFMASGAAAAGPDLCCIDSLCEMALDERFSAQALHGLYGRIVEPLCDDFSTSGAQICNLVLQRIIDFVRHVPQGKGMHCRLAALGFNDSDTLAKRYQRLLQPVPLVDRDRGQIRRVVVLSRVTVGADIVIATIVVHRLLAALPAAEVVLVGPAHLPHCFAEIDRVSCLQLPYERDGSLVDRLVVWESLEKLIREQGEGLAPGEMVLVDPDSRLSQLGLLPLLAEEDTWFFPSRFDQEDGGNSSLSEQVNGWLDSLLGQKSLQPPVVSLPEALLSGTRLFLENLRRNGCRQVIVINFGVGGDGKKRLGEPFETRLPLVLLEAMENTVVIVDSGCASDEKEWVRSQLAEYQSSGIQTDFVEEDKLADLQIGFSHGVVGFHGSIGGIGGLIAGADVFFGYDSCCQHLAGALETPSVIV
ncbi:MAG: hypothetical protein OEL66_10395, partial [Desulfobulbaceae bacterium]|nr:hypothetical protein [Desulfobulbaceae bacterium]